MINIKIRPYYENHEIFQIVHFGLLCTDQSEAQLYLSEFLSDLGDNGWSRAGGIDLFCAYDPRFNKKGCLASIPCQSGNLKQKIKQRAPIMKNQKELENSVYSIGAGFTLNGPPKNSPLGNTMFALEQDVFKRQTEEADAEFWSAAMEYAPILREESNDFAASKIEAIDPYNQNYYMLWRVELPDNAS